MTVFELPALSVTSEKDGRRESMAAPTESCSSAVSRAPSLAL